MTKLVATRAAIPTASGWTPVADRRKAARSRFQSFEELKAHFSARLSPDRIEETLHLETAVFVIRRESTLAEIRSQLLLRLESVLDSLAQGREAPQPPLFADNAEALRPRLR